MGYRDLMLEELHAIRRKHAQETAHLSDEEYVQYLHEKVEKELAEVGYRLTPGPEGTGVLERIEPGEPSPCESLELIEDTESDPMLDEIHEIRRRHAEETKDMTPEEETEYTHEKVSELLREMGYRLVPMPDGTARIERVDDSRRTA